MGGPHLKKTTGSLPVHIGIPVARGEAAEKVLGTVPVAARAVPEIGGEVLFGPIVSRYGHVQTVHGCIRKPWTRKDLANQIASEGREFQQMLDAVAPIGVRA